MSYVIQFAFPEMDGPLYAAMQPEGLGFTTDLGRAEIFVESSGAGKMLLNGYGDETQKCGVVVSLRKAMGR